MDFYKFEEVTIKRVQIGIIYEDNHLLVVEKPANLPTQADESGDNDLLSLLKLYIKEKYEKPGDVYLGLVHRLDRPAGGVMVFARTSKAASRLSEAVRNRDFDKKYFAVVNGVPSMGTIRLSDYLLKDESTNIVKVVDKNTKGAQEAILEYSLTQSDGRLSLIKVDLFTGRSHQIRAQMSNAGYPLFGDQKYGVGINKQGQQLALWSTEIGLEHPIRKERMVFHSLPPRAEPWERYNFK